MSVLALVGFGGRVRIELVRDGLCFTYIFAHAPGALLVRAAIRVEAPVSRRAVVGQVAHLHVMNTLA